MTPLTLKCFPAIGGSLRYMSGSSGRQAALSASGIRSYTRNKPVSKEKSVPGVHIFLPSRFRCDADKDIDRKPNEWGKWKATRAHLESKWLRKEWVSVQYLGRHLLFT